MKKRKIFISTIILSLLLTGCSNLIESTINIDELDTVSGVAMSEVNLEDEGLAFTLINDTDNLKKHTISN
jgi:PBP1b-binding outer membrane lipoprotein LpoB